MRASPTLTAAVMLDALLCALALVVVLHGCSAPAGEECDLQLDGYHCRCPDPAYTIADDAPWPCGHPRDGTCEPVTDCAADRTCHGLDGELVVIGADSLTVTTAGADGGVCTDTHAITRTR